MELDVEWLFTGTRWCGRGMAIKAQAGRLSPAGINLPPLKAETRDVGKCLQDKIEILTLAINYWLKSVRDTVRL